MPGSRLPNESWVQYIGSELDDPTPTGALGRAHFFAPNEGGYLVTLEGGGSGFYPEADLQLIDEPPRDPATTVWVAHDPDGWTVRSGGFAGAVVAVEDDLDAALERGRELAARDDRELVWLTSDGRAIAGRWIAGHLERS